MWTYLALHCSFILAAFIPGYLAYENFFASKNDAKEHIVAYGFGLGLLILGAAQFINFLCARNLALTNSFILGLVCGVLILRAFLCKIRLRNPFGWAFASYVLFSFYCLLLVSLLPAYFLAYKADWALYYPNVAHYVLEKPIEFYRNGLPMEYLVRRTPFFSLINAFFLSYTGNTYAYFQVISSGVNSLIFWAVLIMGQKYYGRKTCAFILLLLALMPAMTYNIGIPTPKPVVIFFILLCFICYERFITSENKWTDAALLAVCLCTAYMIHPSSLFYVVWLLVHQVYLIARKQAAFPWRLAVCGIAAAAVIIAPWYCWGLSVLGAEKILVPTYTISEIKLSVPGYITSRITILLTTLFIPVTEPVMEALKNPPGPLNEAQYLLIWGNYWVRANVETFFGGYGFLASIFFLVSYLTRGKPGAPSGISLPLSLSALGAAACLAVHFLIDHKGLAIGIMGPLLVLLFILFGSRACRAPAWAKAALVAAMLAEFAHHRCLAFKITDLISRLANTRGQKPFLFLYDEISSPGFVYAAATALVVCFALYAFSLKLYSSEHKN